MPDKYSFTYLVRLEIGDVPGGQPDVCQSAGNCPGEDYHTEFGEAIARCLRGLEQAVAGGSYPLPLSTVMEAALYLATKENFKELEDPEIEENNEDWKLIEEALKRIVKRRLDQKGREEDERERDRRSARGTST